MQVSTDGIVKIIGVQERMRKDGNGKYYRGCFADEDNKTYEYMIDSLVAGVLQRMNFGTEVYLTFEATQYLGNDRLRVIDIVTEEQVRKEDGE